MAKKWIAINLPLLLIAGLLARQLQTSVGQFNADNELSKIQPAGDIKPKMGQEKPLPKQPGAKVYSAADFSIIPDKNIFVESRSKEERTESAAPFEVPSLAQKPILVGVVISDTQKTAAIIDPTAPSPNQSRRAQIKRVGDYYKGYRIASIDPDRIVLESGAQQEIIPLHEGSKRARGAKTSIQPTRVVGIGSGTVGSGIPVSTVAAGAGAARATVSTAAPGSTPVVLPAGVQVTTLPTGQPSTAARQQDQPLATAAQARQAAELARQQAQQAQQQLRGTTAATDAQDQRIIRTPFGPIIQTKPDE